MTTTQVRCPCGNSVDVDVDRSEPAYCAVCGSRVEVDDGVERRAAAPRELVDWRLAQRAAGVALLYTLAGSVVWSLWLGAVYLRWVTSRYDDVVDVALVTSGVAVVAFVLIGAGAGVAAERRGGESRTIKAAGMLAAGAFYVAASVLAVASGFVGEYVVEYLVSGVVTTLIAMLIGWLSARLGVALTRASVRPT